MPHISSFGSLPDPGAHVTAAAKSAFSNPALRSVASPSTAPPGDETQASPLQSQLTQLSTVLKNLHQNANLNRTQYLQALNKVKSGGYQVDSLAVSRSMVNDLLTEE
jgi:hypothetical protein